MKKLILILFVAFYASFSFAQTVCPAYTVVPIKFYKPVTANLQVEHFTSCDPEGNTVTWSIVETQTLWKNTGGDIFVNDANAINSSPLTTFTFTLKLLDNGTTNGISDPKFQNYTIILNEYNDAPVINTQSFSINENSLNGTIVGSVVATDVNTRQTKTYSIVSGNATGVFSINSSGNIVVANSTLLNYESATSFPLVIKVTDNGTVPLSAQATVTINVNNVNEAPVVVDQTF